MIKINKLLLKNIILVFMDSQLAIILLKLQLVNNNLI